MTNTLNSFLSKSVTFMEHESQNKVVQSETELQDMGTEEDAWPHL